MNGSGRVAALIVGAAGVLTLSACGGGGAAQTPLSLTQALGEANIPCEAQETGEVRIGIRADAPNQNYLRCSATGGDYAFIVWNEGDDRQQVLRDVCSQAAVDPESASSVNAQAFNTTARVALGSNWIAIAAPESIVKADDLAKTLSGEVNDYEQLCGPFEAEIAMAKDEAEKLAAEEERKDALAGDPYEQQKIVADPNSTEEELRAITGLTEDSNVAYMLAKNPRTPPDALEILATREFSSYGYTNTYDYEVAANPNASTELLKRLVQSGRPATAKRAQYELDKRNAGN